MGMFIEVVYRHRLVCSLAGYWCFIGHSSGSAEMFNFKCAGN